MTTKEQFSREGDVGFSLRGIKNQQNDAVRIISQEGETIQKKKEKWGKGRA